MATPSQRGISKEAVILSSAGACVLLHLTSSSSAYVTHPFLQKDPTQLTSLRVSAAQKRPFIGESKSYRSGIGAAIAGGALTMCLRQSRKMRKQRCCRVIRLAAAPEAKELNASCEDSKTQHMPMVAGALATLAVLASDPAWAQEAASVAEAAEDAEEVIGEVAQNSGDWFDPLIQFNAGIIAGIDGVIEDQLHIPNSFGFAIIGYTLLVKVLTFPLNQTQLRSGAIMQLVRPKIEQIQRKYKNDQETQNRMLLRLYDDCGVNPLGGCIPGIIQFPIFIGLYRSIVKLAQINPKFKEPFLWIPSLAGPTEGDPSLDWLLKSQSPDEYVPLIGWEDAAKYLVLPLLLVGSQVVTQKVSQPDVGNQGGPAAIVSNLVPLVIGYTGLVSPAGLGIYWLSNNLFTQLQTYAIRNQLAEEFPEYQKILDGTWKKEQEEEKKRREEEEAAPEIGGLGRGFGMALDDDDEDEADDKEPEKKEPEKKVLQTEPARPMKRLSQAKTRRRRSRR